MNLQFLDYEISIEQYKNKKIKRSPLSTVGATGIFLQRGLERTVSLSQGLSHTETVQAIG
jgi:hypothetical protein